MNQTICRASHFIIGALFMLLLFAPASATIRGKVVSSFGTPLIGASVTIDGGDNFEGAQCDSAGTFRIDPTTANPRFLTISHVGFQPTLVDIAGIDTAQVLLITLESIVMTGPGITVIDTRRPDPNSSNTAAVSSSDIVRDYSVGDAPLLLESTPNVDAFSDAGAGLGYTYLSIRGFGNERIRLSIDGVPLNDPEDQFLYFVDLPDFVGSVSAIEVQRGAVGPAMGGESFGGRINLVTHAMDQPRQASFTSGIGAFRYGGRYIGEFNKSSAQFSSGLVNGRWRVAGRYSRQSSGGFRENSWYNGSSYFLTAGRLDPRSLTTFTTFGGPMQLHLAYIGVSQEALSQNWRANPLTYAGETDNFSQPQYHLSNSYQLTPKALWKNTLYYIRGVGFYEQFKSSVSLSEYALNPADFSDSVVSLTRRQWVRKNQIGWNSQIAFSNRDSERSLGFAGYFFDSEHWGEVASLTDAPSSFVPGKRYYQYAGRKWNVVAFASDKRKLSARFSSELSMQIVHHNSGVNQDDIGAFTRANSYHGAWTFLSPRATVSFSPRDSHTLTTLFGIASRPPRDADMYDANDPSDAPNLAVKPERLYDYEVGYTIQLPNISAGVNVYYMRLANEVVFYSYDDDGSRRTDNAPSSYRSGAEVEVSSRLKSRLRLSANLAATRNRFIDYRPNIEVYTPGYEIVSHDFAGKTTPGYPNAIINAVCDYESPSRRLTYRWRYTGKQFVEPENFDSLAIGGFAISSITAWTRLSKSELFGDIGLTVTVDNIFNRRHLQSGYGGVYGERTSTTVVEPRGWAEYYPSAGRSLYTQVQLNFK